MVYHLMSALLLVSVVLFDIPLASASENHIRRRDHHGLADRLIAPTRLRPRKSCNRPSPITETTSISSSSSTNTKESPIAPPVEGAVKPSDWPTATQAGAAPAATKTSAADPFLEELSKAYDNSQNQLFTSVHKGQMTYYGQGLGACGDTYDDQSFTAAVSKLMYDAWPGAESGEMNRNPICGPFTPGRKTLNATGHFNTVVNGNGFVNIGGDGLLNCDSKAQCHVPLTATVKHGGTSIIVKIVDRCEACEIGDIDLTPAGFGALADLGLGRTDVEWKFNAH